MGTFVYWERAHPSECTTLSGQENLMAETLDEKKDISMLNLSPFRSTTGFRIMKYCFLVVLGTHFLASLWLF